MAIFRKMLSSCTFCHCSTEETDVFFCRFRITLYKTISLFRQKCKHSNRGMDVNYPLLSFIEPVYFPFNLATLGWNMYLWGEQQS